MSNNSSTGPDRPDQGEHVVLTFVPMPGADPPPFAVRVRGLLKRALRAYGLRCVGIAGRIAEAPGKAVGAGEDGQGGAEAFGGEAAP